MKWRDNGKEEKKGGEGKSLVERGKQDRWDNG